MNTTTVVILGFAAGAVAFCSWAAQQLKDDGVFNETPRRPFRLFSGAAKAMQKQHPPVANSTSTDQPHP